MPDERATPGVTSANAPPTLGITIGVGRFGPLASLAAQRFTHYTGLPAIVLNERELQRCCVDSPHQLKFRLFDLVDADNVVYFDADAVTIRRWDPSRFAGAPHITAVRDFWFSDPIRRESRDFAISNVDYFNSGMFIANRRYHRDWLRLAQQISQTQESRFKDQTYLNAAAQRGGFSVRFVDRRYNWISREKDAADRIPAFVLHEAGPRRKRQAMRATSHSMTQGEGEYAIDEDAFRSLGDAYYVQRIHGLGHSVMQLRPDGTIARGGGPLKRYWCVRCDERERVLTISKRNRHTFLLRANPQAPHQWTGVLMGKPKTVMSIWRHRAQVIADVLYEHGMCEPRLAAEVGVFRGETSALLLRMFDTLRLTLVDPWKAAACDSTWAGSGSTLAKKPQAVMEKAYRDAISATQFAHDRRVVLRLTSERAAAKIADGALDFVFIDGDHSLEAVTRDLLHWTPKVRSGGFVMGHDYTKPPPRKFGVAEAVDAFALHNQYEVHVGPDEVWWFQKP